MGNFDHLFDESYEEKLTEGIDYFLNKDGYRVMTESYLVRRGYCCSNGCLNCPYWPRAQKGNRVLRPGLEKKYKS
ncbi:MAG: DUF5522 domain-containing protein [Prolixibacteraceae bacterium]|jgi:hypothetical protein|nr:DUF5522 domain-containing protein [Prolixibacteraceae bacterium]